MRFNDSCGIKLSYVDTETSSIELAGGVKHAYPEPFKINKIEVMERTAELRNCPGII